MKTTKTIRIIAFVLLMLCCCTPVQGQCASGLCPTGQHLINQGLASGYYNRGVARGFTNPSIVPAKSYPVVPKIVIYDKNNSISMQTGCLVWKHDVADLALVVTASHGFTSDSTRVVVWITPTKGYSAEIMKVDHVWDIAILGIRRPKYEVFKASRNRPILGTVMFVGGFVRGKTMRWVRGSLAGWAGPQGNYPQDLLMVNGGTARSGQSGGPVIDTNGILLGIVVAGDNEGMICVPYFKIAPLVDEVVKECEERGKDKEAHVPDAPLPGSGTSGKNDTLAEIRELIKQNAEVIAVLVAKKSVLGPQGERGPQGPQGPQGVPGASFNASMLTDEYIEAIAARLPPVVLQTITPEGEVIKEAFAPLGSPLKLRLVPIKSGAN